MYERPNNEHLTGIVLLRPRNPPRHHERRHHHHSQHHWVLICFTKVKSIIYPVSWNYHLLADVRSSLRYHAPLLVRWPNLTFPLGPQCNASHSSHSGLLLQYQCTPTVCVHRYQISNLFGSLGYFFSYVFLPCCCNFLIVWLTGQWTPCLVRVDTWVGSSDSIHRQQPSPPGSPTAHFKPLSMVWYLQWTVDFLPPMMNQLFHIIHYFQKPSHNMS